MNRRELMVGAASVTRQACYCIGDTVCVNYGWLKEYWICVASGHSKFDSDDWKRDHRLTHVIQFNEPTSLLHAKNLEQDDEVAGVNVADRLHGAIVHHEIN